MPPQKTLLPGGRKAAARAPAGASSAMARTTIRARRSFTRARLPAAARAPGWCVSAPRCRTAVMPTASAPAQFSRRSSTNTHSAGSSPTRSAPSWKISGCGLCRPTSPEITTPSNSSGERVAVVAAAAPRVRDQPGPEPRGARAAQRLDHRARPAACRRTAGRPGRRAVLDAEQRRRTAGENSSSVSSPASSRRSSASASGSSRKSVLDLVAVEALRLAERAERVPDVGRQHAAVVDQQALHAPGARRAA